MGSGIPLLNEYKQDFFLKRLPQTILGGPKMKLGYEAPIYVYLSQICLFLFPFILAGIFTTFVELNFLQSEVAAYIYGAAMSLFVISVQILSTICQQSNKMDDMVITKKHSALTEDDEVDFTSCCAPGTLSFIIPAKKYKVNILIHAMVSGLMCGTTLLSLLPVSNLKGLYNSNIAAVLLFLFGWFSLCVAQYSLTTTAPPEPATFRTMDTYELSHLMRSLYILICVLVDTIQSIPIRTIYF